MPSFPQALKAAQTAVLRPYFGPSGDEQHQADHTFLQHHDEQVDATLAQPGRRLRGVTWRTERHHVSVLK